MDSTSNVILLRHPRDVLASFHAGLGDGESAVAESGLLSLWDIFTYIKETKSNKNDDDRVCIILHDDLIGNPEVTLRALCKNLGIDFTPSMLKWEKGGIPEDVFGQKHGTIHPMRQILSSRKALSPA